MGLSIAMATYNGAKYLQEQLDSFLAQTRQPDELVVCDDGSTDTTLQIIENFAAIAPFNVRVFKNQTKLGYVENFSRAMSHCTGELVFLSDQDDFWFSNKIEFVCNIFQAKSNVWVIINDAEITDEYLNPAGLTILGQTYTAGLCAEEFITGCCSAYRNSIAPALLPVPSATHTHDGWLHLLGLSYGCREVLPNPLQYYRRHNTNTSGWITGNLLKASPLTLQRRLFALKNIKQDPVMACENRILQLRVYEERLEQSPPLFLETFYSAIKNSQTRIKIKINANENRKALLLKPIIPRFFSALKFYRADGYCHFEGLKSFAKDVLFR
ncbi:glycosyltransferase family 2 protein [Crenothrix sp.]|uniref:glycosyltransferase family 2 protein n=1 Tax=Crenothrix sp. TaxID=3100433 RepID=UPI00374D7541